MLIVEAVATTPEESDSTSKLEQEDQQEHDHEDSEEEEATVEESGEEDVEEDSEEEDDNGFEQQSSDDESIDSDDDETDDEAFDPIANEKLRAKEKEHRDWLVGRQRSQEIEKAKVTGELASQKLLHVDDLSSDDEEAEGNTVGRIPLHWYDAYDHIGYDAHGRKVIKQGSDTIDRMLASRDSNGGRVIYDMYNGREVVLTQRELEIIHRIQAGAFAHPEFNDTPDYVDYFSSQIEQMPLSAAPEPKRRFVPSKWELMKVMKIVKAMKEGRYKQDKEDDDQKPPVYMIWNDEEDEIIAESKRFQFHLPAPKMPLPGHAESYNPPEEYLLNKEEKEKFDALDPSDRPYNFLPKKHSCLRHVAGYENFVRERFERCLDLYLCPRKLKRRMNIDPETLIPKLPSPKELKPFPNSLCLQFVGHSAGVRSISISPDGQYIASGSDDGSVRLWEIDTGLCRNVWLIGKSKKDSDIEAVTEVFWNPDMFHHMLVAVVGKRVVLIATGTGDEDSTHITEAQLTGVEAAASNGKDQSSASSKKSVNEDNDSDDGGQDEDNTEVIDVDAGKFKWVLSENPARQKNTKDSKRKITVSGDNESTHFGSLVGPRVEICFAHIVTKVAWHHKGDYLCVITPDGGAKAVSIHQVIIFSLCGEISKLSFLFVLVIKGKVSVPIHEESWENPSSLFPSVQTISIYCNSATC